MGKNIVKTSITIEQTILQIIDDLAEDKDLNRSTVINLILTAVLTSPFQNYVHQIMEEQDIDYPAAIRTALKLYLAFYQTPDIKKYAERSRRTPEEFALHLIDRGIIELKMYEGSLIP